MKSPEREESMGETLRSLGLVMGIAVLFFCWGLTIYATVGDKGAPPWDFGTVPDIPGESPYSTHRIREVADLAPLPVETRELVDRQHVDEQPWAADILKEKRP